MSGTTLLDSSTTLGCLSLGVHGEGDLQLNVCVRKRCFSHVFSPAEGDPTMQKLDKMFNILSVLGQGSFGSVYKARRGSIYLCVRVSIVYISLWLFMYLHKAGRGSIYLRVHVINGCL